MSTDEYIDTSVNISFKNLLRLVNQADQEALEERAAMFQYDANMSQEAAEALAVEWYIDGLKAL